MMIDVSISGRNGLAPPLLLLFLVVHHFFLFVGLQPATNRDRRWRSFCEWRKRTTHYFPHSLSHVGLVVIKDIGDLFWKHSLSLFAGVGTSRPLVSCLLHLCLHEGGNIVYRHSLDWIQMEFVKPFLSDREKKMICAILVLQVINNLAIIVLTQETEGEHSFDHWAAIWMRPNTDGCTIIEYWFTQLSWCAFSAECVYSL